MLNKSKKYFFIGLGLFFLLLGIIGVVLPLLPTTPFLILAAFFFNHGSPHFHNWLINHKVFGPPIQDWQKDRVIRTKYKVFASLMMTVSLYFVFTNERIPAIGSFSTSAFIAIVSIYIWTRKGK